ncbi:MAG: hypothetical protein ACFFD2_15640 [Promethearchaeota archaeon]
MKLVEAKFFETYRDILAEKNRDLDYFKGFGEIIEENFADTSEKRTEEAL